MRKYCHLFLVQTFLTPGLKRTLAITRTVEVEPEHGIDPNEPKEDWQLKYYEDETILQSVRDKTLNLSLRPDEGEDALYDDIETILADVPSDKDEDEDEDDQDKQDPQDQEIEDPQHLMTPGTRRSTTS